MISLLIFVVTLGQCGPSGCSMRSTDFMPVPAPVLLAQLEPQKPVVQLGMHWIEYQGIRVLVQGWKMPNGNITWHPEWDVNRQALAQAQAAKAARPVTSRIANYGLSPEHMSKGRQPMYTAAGEEAQQFVAEAKAHAIEAEALRLHVTVIGTEAERKPVITDLKTHPKLAGLSANLFIQDYEANEWPVNPALGFQAGHPTILIQGGKTQEDPKGGKVLWRASDYSMGPDGLAEAVRKLDPAYRPEADPGPATGLNGCPLGFSAKNWPEIGLAIAALVALYLYRHKESYGV